MSEVSMTFRRGAVSAVIGPNGAGKSTLFNCISGVYTPDVGRITIDGTDTDGMRPWQVARHGVARTYQNVALFPSMNVLDNLLLAAHGRVAGGFARNVTQLRRVRTDERAERIAALELLERFDLAALAEAEVGELPYGHRKRIELCRAMFARPKLLLLDEPAAGLNTEEKSAMADQILTMHAEADDLSIVLIEHEMPMVMRLAEHICVLNFGRLVSKGTPAEIQADPDVRAAYLGDEIRDA